MAKIYLLVVAIFISFNLSSQTKDLPKFDFENYNFSKAIVVEVKGKGKVQLEDDLRSWINSYFNESTLLDSKFSEDSFLISGKSLRFLKIKNLPTDLKYDIKISLRDQKYRFEVRALYYKYYTEYRIISDVDLIKDDVIKKDLLESRSIITAFINNLNSNLFRYITKENNEW
ncbi:DUF4468 domain-containing protein [Psychroflexus lacisalsi]|jgi:hypothetical protein|uniref:DUF4468 domain-containing protein n=1 Tax=Psychroflexus lacisalsi TaxID=503928 RepID=A0ABP3VPS1_9FLAO|nr:DUF4468 domain-containing protein [Psychroflexus lacisalsi]MBZ9620620.1 DUF4468 domain-containing protein [Psychroflexus lacisalsi]